MSRVVRSLADANSGDSVPKPFTEIVGDSAAIREVKNQIDTVARTDSTVLILGETGTGKELAARAIHERSARHRGPFMALNCAAIPTTLLESELFGHERGSFTGAHARRAGRFELAGDGTMFLDELGEMPLDAQPRLLRVLQERTFERLGSQSTLHTNVRVVAATNRDLKAMCEARTFREDLYYRLNVFPIWLPPLRVRRADIPLLAQHLVEKFAAQMNKEIRAISNATMSALMAHEWPGNVRELQNVLERAVILATGPQLELASGLVCAREHDLPSLAEVNRAHIVAALRTANGVVAGPSGAAARLGMKRSTLVFRMKKLGIPYGAEYRRYEDAPHRSHASPAWGVQINPWPDQSPD